MPEEALVSPSAIIVTRNVAPQITPACGGHSDQFMIFPAIAVFFRNEFGRSEQLWHWWYLFSKSITPWHLSCNTIDGSIDNGNRQEAVILRHVEQRTKPPRFLADIVRNASQRSHAAFPGNESIGKFHMIKKAGIG